MKYQIRFCNNKWHGSFEYIDVESSKGVEKKAAEKATEYIILQNERAASIIPFIPFYINKPMKTVHVWEYDQEKRQPKKGGHRFRLRLAFVEVAYVGGGKRREEWYEPVIEDKK